MIFHDTGVDYECFPRLDDREDDPGFTYAPCPTKGICRRDLAVRDTNQEYQDLRVKIANIMNGEDQSNTKTQHPTIFHELLKSNLPAQEKSIDRLGDEA